MTIINALLVMLSLLEKQIQFKNIPHKMVEYIENVKKTIFVAQKLNI